MRMARDACERELLFSVSTHIGINRPVKVLAHDCVLHSYSCTLVPVDPRHWEDAREEIRAVCFAKYPSAHGTFRSRMASRGQEPGHGYAKSFLHLPEGRVILVALSLT